MIKLYITRALAFRSSVVTSMINHLHILVYWKNPKDGFRPPESNKAPENRPGPTRKLDSKPQNFRGFSGSVDFLDLITLILLGFSSQIVWSPSAPPFSENMLDGRNPWISNHSKYLPLKCFGRSSKEHFPKNCHLQGAHPKYLNSMPWYFFRMDGIRKAIWKMFQNFQQTKMATKSWCLSR